MRDLVVAFSEEGEDIVQVGEIGLYRNVVDP